jgi:signal transduction histidine kinase
LRTLASAVDHLAVGDAAAPLPASGISEVGRLASNFGELRDRLTARTAERARLLAQEQELRRSAEAAGRAKDEFLATAAHELKTPVAAVKGFVQLLARWTPEQRAAREAQALTALERQADRLTRLIQDLLEVSRLATGRLELRRAPVEVGQLAAGVLARMEGLAPGHVLRLDAEGLAWVDGDADRLDQVLVNLVSNAVKFSPDGGEVAVQVRPAAAEVVVAVRDQGIGIPVARQGQVFERFYRAHAGTEHDYGGMGIGLHFSREVVERHGGRLWFESAEGAGSTFYVGLPRLAVGGADAARAAAAGGGGDDGDVGAGGGRRR